MTSGTPFKIAVAPMMEWTDRHFRYLARLMSANAHLYTEMVTAAAVLHGNLEYLLGYDEAEHPLVLQLGGSDPRMLAKACKRATAFGYDEINLNVGCPSDRVQSGMFGACLMKYPELLRDCFVAMQEAVSVPVSIKTRLGVDDQDSYAALHNLIVFLYLVGCCRFTLYLRKAWLRGDYQSKEVSLAYRLAINDFADRITVQLMIEHLEKV